MNSNFFSYQPKTGLLAEFDKELELLPSNLYGFAFDPIMFVKNNHAVESNTTRLIRERSTLFGFVEVGNTTIRLVEEGKEPQKFVLTNGMYFSIPLWNYISVSIIGGNGYIAEKIGYHGFFSIGGAVEENGRLKYIDGCTDSLLIPPIKLGDPCLNLLVFPPNTDQTEHTHPSVRLGMVISGKGWCKTPLEEIALTPGMIFCIPTDKEHAFKTDSDEGMRVIAYHPDSDFGPTDEFHPMLNRTIVEGVSANQIEEIRTK